MHDKFSKTIEITKKPSFFGFFFWKFGAKITNILAETDIFNFFLLFSLFFRKAQNVTCLDPNFMTLRLFKRKKFLQ